MRCIIFIVFTLFFSPSIFAKPNTDADTHFLTLAQEFFDQVLKENPIFATYIGVNNYNDRFNDIPTPENREKQVNLKKSWQDKLKNLDYTQLSKSNQVTYDVWLDSLSKDIKSFEIKEYLIPYSQFDGPHIDFPALGQGSGVQPFVTIDDYLKFIKRVEGFVQWMDYAIELFKMGITEKIVLPKKLAEKILPQLETHIVDDPTKSIFYGPIQNFPKSFTKEQQRDLKEQYTSMILNKIIPIYKRSFDFIKNEYLPHCRDTYGLSYLPGGIDWYNFKIFYHTTMKMDANSIHEQGIKEVNRILEEMKKVKNQVGFIGDIKSFFKHLLEDEKYYFKSKKELVNAYDDVRVEINKRLPKLFSVFPKADYEVRAVEDFREQSSAGAFYQAPTPDGKRPGIFYINGFNLMAQPKYGVETLSIHEASPGHHFQIAIQQELKDLPNIRKFSGYTVFSEGWALYAESLGKELGLFTDPLMWYGRLNDEQLRAMRLVVDTGIHALGWTREVAIQFMVDNSSLALSDITSEVERYIANPGQALAYKIGQWKIQELKEKWMEKMGKNGDIRAFHAKVLQNGSVPMAVLEKIILGD